MFVVTSKQMYQAECNAVRRGMSFSQLMENAGIACANIIQKQFCISNDNTKRAVVICGKGKNGGDGFVIARKLWESGLKVTIILACGEPQANDALENYFLTESAGIETIKYENNLRRISAVFEKADFLIEAVFGTGFSGALDNRLSALAQLYNNSKGKHIAIDVPGGTKCDSATIEGNIFKADMTIAISAYKPIHIMKPCSALCGRLFVADIGITEDDFKNLDSVACISYNAMDIRRILPKRKSISNKSSYGHALCVCGSLRMVGAAKLSVGGALRSGAGLVTAAFPRCIYPALSPCLVEPLLLPLDANRDGTFADTAAESIIKASEKASAALIGCGIGFNSDTSNLVHSLVRALKIPTVIDADGINALSTNISAIRDAKAPLIITPHPGEMSRLCGKSIDEIVADPITTAFEFAVKHKIIVVLKTANTVVCGGDPAQIYVNSTGNSGLARGGSGDLLAGMTVSLLAQGMEPFDAAVSAVYLHGLCADAVAEKSSQRGMLPSDVLNYLPNLFSKFE